MRIRSGMAGDRRLTEHARGSPSCALDSLVGTEPTTRDHVHTAATLDEITLDSHKRVDPVPLAGKFAVDMCAVDGGRFWLSDDTDVQGGDVVDLGGVRLLYGAELTAAARKVQMATPYLSTLIYRNSNWFRHAGTPVHLVREPNGTDWVMQECAKDVDPNLTLDTLHLVGDKLRDSPRGWIFETKVPMQDLSLNTARCEGCAAIIRDELHCADQGCGCGANTSAS